MHCTQRQDCVMRRSGFFEIPRLVLYKSGVLPSGSQESRKVPTQLSHIHNPTSESTGSSSPCLTSPKASVCSHQLRGLRPKTSSLISHRLSSTIFILSLRLRALDQRRSRACSRIASMVSRPNGYVMRRDIGSKISTGMYRPHSSLLAQTASSRPSTAGGKSKRKSTAFPTSKRQWNTTATPTMCTSWLYSPPILLPSQ